MWSTPVIRKIIWNPSMTWAFEGFGNANLPGFANDDFLGLEDKD